MRAVMQDSTWAMSTPARTLVSREMGMDAVGRWQQAERHRVEPTCCTLSTMLLMPTRWACAGVASVNEMCKQSFFRCNRKGQRYRKPAPQRLLPCVPLTTSPAVMACICLATASSLCPTAAA